MIVNTIIRSNRYITPIILPEGGPLDDQVVLATSLIRYSYPLIMTALAIAPERVPRLDYTGG